MPHYKFKPHPTSSHMQIAKLIHAHKYQHVLDLGCAGGFLLKSLGTNWSGKLIGIDNDPAWKDSPYLSQYTKVIWQDLNTKLPPIPSTDCTVAADIVEHLKKPQHLLSQLTSPNIIVSLPNANYLPARLLHFFFPNLRHNSGPLDATHLHFLDKKSSSKLLTDAGYTINSILVTPAPIFPSLGNLLAKLVPDHFAYQYIYHASK